MKHIHSITLKHPDGSRTVIARGWDRTLKDTTEGEVLSAEVYVCKVWAGLLQRGRTALRAVPVLPGAKSHGKGGADR